MFSRDPSSSHTYKPISVSDYSDDSDQGEFEDDFVSQQIKNQRLQLREQDQGLEMLSQSANRLGQLSLGISEEMGHQNKMLDEMEDDLNKATNDLHYVTNKTRELIKKSGGKKNFLIIVALSLVVLILLFLVIYT